MIECTICKVEKLEINFRPKHRQCKNCIKLKRKQNYASWYAANKDKICEKEKACYLKSKEGKLKSSKKNYYDNFLGTIMRGIKSRSRLKNLELDFDKKYLEELYKNQKGKCALTGISFSFNETDKFRRPFAPSIDRINNNIGYLKNNIRFVCIIVNSSINEFGENDFETMCRFYIAHKDGILLNNQ